MLLGGPTDRPSLAGSKGSGRDERSGSSAFLFGERRARVHVRQLVLLALRFRWNEGRRARRRPAAGQPVEPPSAEGHRIEADAQRLQHQPRKRNREWESSASRPGGSQVSEEQQDDEHDEDTAQQHGPADPSQRRRDELRLVVDNAQLDTLRQRTSDLFDRLTNPGGDVDRVGAELLDDSALTTSPFRRCAMPRRTAAASRISATSPRRTGTSPRVVTTVRRRSSTVCAPSECPHRPLD